MRPAAETGSWARVARAALAVTTLAGALAAGGCADIRRANVLGIDPVDPSSPVAADAVAASEAKFKTPSFRDVPPKPVGVQSASAYKANVVAVVKDRRDLGAWRAAHPQYTDDTEAFAAAQRAKLPASITAPVSSKQDAETQAFADKLRQEAAAPPPKPQ